MSHATTSYAPASGATMTTLQPKPQRPSILLRPMVKPSRNNMETGEAQWEIEQCVRHRRTCWHKLPLRRGALSAGPPARRPLRVSLCTAGKGSRRRGSAVSRGTLYG